SKGLHWSDEVYNIWGFDKKTFHLDYDSYFNTIHPDDREEFLKSRERAFNTGIQHDIEHRIMLKDGTIKWVHTLGNLVRNEQGEIIIFEGTVQDITKDKLALEKLMISEARYEYVTRATSDAIWDWNLRTDEVYYGGAFQTLFGFAADIPKSHSTFWENHVHPDDVKKTLEEIQSIINGDAETWTLEYRFRKSDGKYAFVEDKGILIKDQSGTPIKMVGAMHDISEVKIGERQESLHTETSRLFNQPEVHLNDILSQVLQHILSYGDISVVEIWLPESDKKHLKLGARHTKGKQFDIFYEESFGVKSFLSSEGLPGKVWQTSRIEYWDDIDTNLNFLRNAAAKKAALKSAIGLPLIYNDEFIGVLVLCLQEKGEYLLEYGAFRDSFCQHLSSEIKRKQLDQELKQIFSFAPDVISVAGTDGYFKKINPAACEMLEYTEQELLSLPVTAFIHPDDRDITGQLIGSPGSGQSTFYFENRYIAKSGKIIWLAWTSTPSPEEGLLLAVAKDITDKKKLEVLLEKSNILAEMGGWEVDVQNNSIYWSSVTKTIHEVEPDFEADLETAVNFYPKGLNRDTIRNAVEKAIIDGTPWDMELEIVTAKGNKRWVRAIGEAEFVNDKCVKLYGSLQNITNRKVAEIELLKIYDEKNTILESIQDGFYALDKNWVVTYWNHEAENLLSLMRSDVVDKNFWEVFENAVDLKFYSEYHRAVSENVPVRFEEFFAPVNGWFEVSAFPSEEGLTVYFRDVTNRKNTELELLQFKKIIDNSRDGIAIVDLEGKATYVNPAFAQVLGYDPAIHHHPESIYANRKLVAKVFDTLLSGKYWQGDVEVKNPKGDLISYYLSGGPVLDEDGQLKAVYGIHTDITERKQAEARIRKAYHERNTILESIGDGFFAVDKVGTVTYWNREAEKLLGITKIQAVGHHLQEVFTKMVDSRSFAHYFEAIESNQVLHFEDYYPSLHKWHEVSAYPSVDGLSVFFKDITERKIYDIQVRELNKVLKTKVKELAVSNRELEQFAYVASHDLQEPLRMISSFLTQLQRKYDDKLDAKAHQYIHFAVDGAKRMRQIILDLLDFSRVGRVDAEFELVNFNEVVSEILILFRKNIEDTKALFVLSELPSIVVPKTNIRQLLQNLISNAIKYHPPGVTPLVEIGYSETPEHWEFWVKDNGIGISPDYFDKIFIIFQRLHTKDEFSGTGMGLAICRKIVDNLGGKLWVESEEGNGSTFFFTIPKPINREMSPPKL
ncbi:MAG: PAS domain S-box protein, partial [Daejeonella sp.]|uniref:PAS domain S-box protein n=1 Tax=Daejeonella sp. TaxID=2805397 RepID=UPI003C742EED